MCASPSNPPAAAPRTTLEFLDAPAHPVIGPDHPELAGNRYGFEGGSVIYESGVFHLFTAEMADDPFWAKMRLAHWSSPDGANWQRVGTLYETPGTMIPGDTRFSLWSPMPIFNAAEDRWNLFYIAYRPGFGAGEGLHMDGRVWRAISQQPGRSGIGGPYRDDGIVLQPDADSQPWEGQQGTDSFYPWPVGGKWRAFYGSHNHVPHTPWLVGLAEAPALAGPWRRCPGVNPSPIEPHFIENPIVVSTAAGFIAIYDNCLSDAGTPYLPDGRHVGYSVSTDSVHWPQGRSVAVQPEGPANWSDDVRTPLCLVSTGDDHCTMIYTAKLRDRNFWGVGLARLRLRTS
ncbi:hypothetical protein K0B96_12810 [Horticoccus luteus]|uniref:Glycosyl hydrolase family 43 n=1 Tax=Horticoccus luteus TaxID=2862869 RepID=A0A8F9TS32_9BACT|nr:hypothetical protein [Horticoccus luteus]QYM78179.1 hypothetical protein K0B96_12810 [Horticoccus luteus]